MYYVYMLECDDNSIYTGITSDITRRMNEHYYKTKKCAKYTKVHSVKKLLALWKTGFRSDACTLEYHMKKLSKENKLLIISKEKTLEDLFSNNFDVSVFDRAQGTSLEDYIQKNDRDII